MTKENVKSEHKSTPINYLLLTINFILFGNIYVALGAVCLVQSTCIQLQFTDHLFAYSTLVFFATLFVYNFQRFFYKTLEDSELNSIRRQWIAANQILVKVLAVIGFIGVAITFFFNEYRIVFYLSPLLILSFAYFSSFIKLRKSPLFKLFTLVIVWTMVTAVVPVLLGDTDIFTKNNLLHIFTRFCFMMAICIPFDLRDIQIDAADNISTLPLAIGEKNAKRLAIGFMVIYLISIVLENAWGILSTKIFLALLASALINAVLVLMSNSKRGEYFYVALIDGTMILQGVMLLLAEWLI